LVQAAVLLLLISDVLSYHRFVSAYGRDELPSGPEVLPHKIAFLLSVYTSIVVVALLAGLAVPGLALSSRVGTPSDTITIIKASGSDEYARHVQPLNEDLNLRNTRLAHGGGHLETADV
jgi:hypothetical protein